jgi:hypothetical protein
MVISSCDAGTGVSGDAAQFALSASGAKANPNAIVITDQTGLAAIESAPSGDYVLGASFAVTNWKPICGPDTVTGPFTGTFDGAGYTITVQSFHTDVLTTFGYLGIFATTDGPETAISNLTVNIAVNPIVTETAQWFGGVVAYAENTTFTNIQVDGVLDIISSIPAPTKLRNVWETVNGARVLNVNATTDSGFNVGGVVGYANNTSITKADSRLAIATAGSVNTAVFTGGIAGFTDYSTITGSRNSGVVIGNGPGYNTSAGGIAGYIVASDVSNSFASGKVELTGFSTQFDWDDSWQIDAGGLVGYAGGADDRRSTITRSYATGNVSATAPFPYAGGLVGYVYGYNNFSDPAMNGTLVSRSYATGNVVSTSQDDPKGVVGDIPYAGGLVGYSSIIGSTIEDSYARGNATVTTNGTYAWAGGLIGGNANDAVVNRVYATGDVESRTGSLPPLYAPDYADAGPAAGGIAGFNYYTVKTSINYSFALNGLVDGNQTTAQDMVHRVAGSLGNKSGFVGILSNNRANEKMKVVDNWKPEYGTDKRDGANTAERPAQSVYTDLSWDFRTVWTMGSDGYPILQWL